MLPEPLLPTPEQKIRVLEGSLRCFVFGLCSLIPILGVGFAIAAGRARWSVRRAYKGRWNPARRYLRWGTGLACVGALLGAGLITIVALMVAQEAL